MQKTNVAVVGCGYWGPNLIRNFRSLPGCHLKVMCDLDEQRLKHLHQLYPEVEGSTNFEAILADREINAVAIATAVRGSSAIPATICWPACMACPPPKWMPD